MLAVGAPAPAQQDSSGEELEPVDPDQLRAAVDGGLGWLAEHQVQEGADAGSWRAGPYPTAATSLAGLAFLAHGHLPGEEPYGQTVTAAMEYVKDSMRGDGYLGSQGDSMYVHGICTLFGLAYLGNAPEAERDAELAEWCRKAIGLIVEAQRVSKPEHAQGGWRYSPHTTESDLSVTSWQLLALHAARQCGYRVPPGVFDKALRYIQSAYRDPDDGPAGFVYRPGISRKTKPGVTGAALSLRSMLGRRDAELAKAVAGLKQLRPRWGGEQYDGYYFTVNFYMAQGFLQWSEPEWRRFIQPTRRVLVDHQAGDGHWPFPPGNYAQSKPAGKAYTTAMALLILAMDKQYLPMYSRQASLFEARP